MPRGIRNSAISEMETMEMEPRLKLIQRDIAADPAQAGGSWAASDVEMYVSDYLNAGWTLKEVLGFGRNLAGEKSIPVFTVMFVLVK